MTMFKSLKPKTVFCLAYYGYAALVALLLSTPTIAVLVLAANNQIGFWLGFYLHMTTFCAAGLLWSPLLIIVRYEAARVAQRHRIKRLVVAGCSLSISQRLYQKAEQAQWRTLASMLLLFGAHALTKPLAQAQAPTREHAEPKAVSQPTQQQLAIVRQLQSELHLNEHGVIKALKYLRQGYGEAYVRNLFASTVRKS